MTKTDKFPVWSLEGESYVMSPRQGSCIVGKSDRDAAVIGGVSDSYTVHHYLSV